MDSNDGALSSFEGECAITWYRLRIQQLCMTPKAWLLIESGGRVYILNIGEVLHRASRAEWEDLPA